MSGEEPKNSRRQLLRGITGSLASLPVVVSGASADDQEQTIDVTFDPTDRKQTLEFITTTFEESERIHTQANSNKLARDRIQSVRQRTLDQLSDEQIEAIGAELADINLKIEGRPVIRGGGTEQKAEEPWDYADFSTTVTAKIELRAIGRTEYEAFDFTHEIEWEHKPLEGVRAIDATGSGTGKHYVLAYWDYKGTDDKDITIRQDGNFFTSDMTGVFEGCLFIGGWTCQRDDRMYTRTAGNWNGTGTLLESELQ